MLHPITDHSPVKAGVLALILGCGMSHRHINFYTLKQVQQKRNIH